MGRIDKYMAVGLSPTVWGAEERSDIQKNLDHIHENLSAATWLSGTDLPVKLAVIPEGALQGFTDEVFDMDHQTYRDEIAVDIPGKESDTLGEYAKEFGIYIVASAKEKAPEYDDRFYNTAFVISPDGELILKHRKNTPLLPVERSVTPHDMWDDWVEEHGKDLDSFFPVVDTDIGRIGISLAIEGAYPEYVRGLAMNGAEVVCRIACPEPMVANNAWEIQNKARALDNNVYFMAPNLGTYYLTQDKEEPIDTFGGGSMLVDHKGRTISEHDYGAGSSYCAGVIDIEGLREFRTRSPQMNWIKDLRTELCEVIYDRELYPKNLWLDDLPVNHEEYNEEVTQKQIELMVEKDIYVPPYWEREE
ncbi:hydrolase [Natrarchaeobius halalkaliphilus]|uniref:Hydrolase n=1 Tax=Natrarchaeobius halalkaliphilus TaxID=1679091 RepID=A0A3N6LYC0_9EURY|nr:nitrilase-related carbon-nitrogen hydrolase [Natrarchaeobius halalkaliphilus]RQG86712.1 hydrolase [Natrarchaeobius halalkaliphilus]